MDINENLVVSNLIANEPFARKVIPFLNETFFTEKSSKIIFKNVFDFFSKYKQHPSKQSLAVDVENLTNVNNDTIEECKTLIDKADEYLENNTEWLVERTEKFCQEKAIYNALMESIQIADGQDKNKPKTSIPKILSDALAVSFNTTLGHDYFDDAEKRYDSYHNKTAKFPFHINILNDATKGGIERKTLNAILAGTGVGKSLIMCDLAAHYLEAGLNVLYFTLEMSEEKISQRVDANLMDIDMQDFDFVSKDVFMKKIHTLKGKTTGRFKVKEYPTSGATVLDFRAYIEELKIKQNFKADIIIVDYLTICNSARYKNAPVNSYTLYKAVAEELRGLAIEENAGMWTGLQFNRGGNNNSDAGLTDTAESFGIPMSLDLLVVAIVNDELIAANQIMIKQEKSRYDDINRMKKFLVGVNRQNMRLEDCDQEWLDSAGDDEDVSIMDKGNFMEKDTNRKKKSFGRLNLPDFGME